MKIFGRFSSLINFVIILCLALVFSWAVVIWYFDKDGPLEEAVVIDIPQGSGIISVSRELADKGVVTDANFFRLMSLQGEKYKSIKYGEYEIPAGASMREVLDILVEGKAIQLSVTFPEGWTSWQIVNRLNEAEGLTGEIEDIPEEGSLAPNTYSYSRGATRQSIIDTMKERQQLFLQEAWKGRDAGSPLKSPEELLTLASIIEKETSRFDERFIVASVFINRLNLGMKLQTDPTVIYGITLGEGPLGRGIRQSELEAETPYNTYVIEGLPPTPICNPGKASIFAAANPYDTDFRYFVAKTKNPSDGHNFAVTLEEHNANVQIYRKAPELEN